MEPRVAPSASRSVRRTSSTTCAYAARSMIGDLGNARSRICCRLSDHVQSEGRRLLCGIRQVPYQWPKAAGIPDLGRGVEPQERNGCGAVAHRRTGGDHRMTSRRPRRRSLGVLQKRLQALQYQACRKVELARLPNNLGKLGLQARETVIGLMACRTATSRTEGSSSPGGN